MGKPGNCCLRICYDCSIYDEGDKKNRAVYDVGILYTVKISKRFEQWSE